MLAKKKPNVTSRPTPQRLKVPVVLFVRVFLLGSVAVVACAYAIYRYYTVPYVPMLVPVPSASASEIEIEVAP